MLKLAQETNGISDHTVKTQMKRAYAFLRTEGTENILRLLFLWSTDYSFFVGLPKHTWKL